ncbi:E3 ubiquitin-protein ligase TRIM32 [Merluccius polli]|uniref:E3 ubiquitin-protein ligase TRIM32 n=1 Tax=Merluccius polli TaxID=89951 RepID=A0AA47NP41_MERPO|nr:E3 ubiquitin-protein ligase TRIM32 [Merluccius polli]
MFVGSPLSSNPTSPIPTLSLSPQFQSEGDFPDEPDSAPLPLSPLPCWATQALCDLARAETELHHLQERQAAETEAVKRGVERAVLGARREERRLAERVEQDHRDAQQRLDRVHRDNAAAAQISQSLLDQRLRRLANLRSQIQRCSQRLGQNQSGSDHNLLLQQGVAELLQPWEISLSLKKVTFKPSSQTNAVDFGDIRVQEHSLSLPVGWCGPQGQLCALHSGEIQCGEASHGGAREERTTPDGGSGAGQSLTLSTGRVVRKIRLSARSDEDSVEEAKASSLQTRHWPPKREQSDFESSPEDDMDLPTAVKKGEEVSLAVPAVHTTGDSEGDELEFNMSRRGRSHIPRNQRKPRNLRLRDSSVECSKSEHIKLNQHCGLDSQDKGDGGRVKWNSKMYSCAPQTLSKMAPKEPLASQSCLDLTYRTKCHSRLSQYTDDHSTPGDSGRAPSPVDSLDSCDTFIVTSPREYRGSLNHHSRLSRSAADLTRKTPPLISANKSNHNSGWKLQHSSGSPHCSGSALTSPSLRKKKSSLTNVGEVLPRHGGMDVGHQMERRPMQGGGGRVARSLSMSVIDGAPQEPCRGRERRGGEPALAEIEEDRDSSLAMLHVGSGHLIGQFGKQGSGRSDLTLPSGVHSTPQGQVFIVDCGNARVQVTDPRGNVLQHITSPTSEGSTRRCRNYFDIAVNAKGLIALSCAAERALLVFSRHGRLFQTFGGSGCGSTRGELEAPRGVTVTRLDEFLIADIRKGTLVALKLDPKTGSCLERTVVTGFHRPYLVAASLSTGMVAVSERGSETGREPCVKVLEPGWNTVRVLGVCSGMGPVLACPWGLCIDGDGNVLVADWGEQHKVILYPAQGVGWPVISHGLSSPRGLALLPEGHLVVSDSMHHCIKIYQYK